MSSFRTERDTMGEMQVPADALYGASTARAIENFPVAHEPVPAAVIHAFGYLKAACARANQELGKLDEKIAKSIISACEEVAAGKHRFALPRRHLSNRLRHFDQHECERSDRQPGQSSLGLSASAQRARKAPSIRTITSTWASRRTTRSRRRCTSPPAVAISAAI